MNQKGLTFIELIIVIVMIGIMGVLLIPNPGIEQSHRKTLEKMEKQAQVLSSAGRISIP